MSSAKRKKGVRPMKSRSPAKTMPSSGTWTIDMHGEWPPRWRTTTCGLPKSSVSRSMKPICGQTRRKSSRIQASPGCSATRSATSFGAKSWAKTSVIDLTIDSCPAMGAVKLLVAEGMVEVEVGVDDEGGDHAGQFFDLGSQHATGGGRVQRIDDNGAAAGNDDAGV